MAQSGTITSLTLTAPPTSYLVSTYLITRGDAQIVLADQTTADYYTATGTGFTSESVASISGAGVTVTSQSIISSTELRFTISVANDAPAGLRKFIVTKSGNVQEKVNAFEVFQYSFVPKVNWLSEDQFDSTYLIIDPDDPDFSFSGLEYFPAVGNGIPGFVPDGEIVGGLSFPDTNITQGSTVTKAVLRTSVAEHQPPVAVGGDWPLGVYFGVQNEANPGPISDANNRLDTWSIAPNPAEIYIPAPDGDVPSVINLTSSVNHVVNLPTFAGNRINVSVRLFDPPWVNTLSPNSWYAFNGTNKNSLDKDELDVTTNQAKYSVARLFVNLFEAGSYIPLPDYIPNPNLAQTQAFINEYVESPTGSIQDDFKNALKNVLDLPNSNLTIDDLWKLYLTNRFGYFVGNHPNHYPFDGDI